MNAIRKIVLISGILLAWTGGLTAVASAQGTDEKCLRNVKDICGDEPANLCFSNQTNWDYTLPECEGDIQTMIEMAREAGAGMDSLIPAASWGGKLRSGAGTEFSQVGSLKEGEPVSLVENTGVIFNGFPWFKILYQNPANGQMNEAYQWGGILCAFSDVEGVYQRCPADWPAGSQAGSGITEDPIAPVHGNSDEDNAQMDTDAKSAVKDCLERESNAARDGSACIGKIADACLDRDTVQTTVSMRQCVSREYTVWDTLLNEMYREVMSIAPADKTELVRSAQLNWVKFKESFCALPYQILGGSMFLLSGDQCATKVTATQYLNLVNLRNDINPGP
ncbi:MAG: lysozyme inhibitor LprI family protein [Rhizobiaceae bacterium]